MSDWRDVMEARSDADHEVMVVKSLPPDLTTDALVHALLAIRYELRALSVTLDYASGVTTL